MQRLATRQNCGEASDPRPVLRRLISAFQNCGPPGAYQVLGVQLFHIIAMQTNGMGCYPEIRMAGPVQNMVVSNNVLLPDGPVFSVRVRHVNGLDVDWFIGLSNITGKVEYLRYQAAETNEDLPDVQQGPRPNGGGGTPVPEGRPRHPVQPPDGNTIPVQQRACEIYPEMCQ